MKEKIEKKKQKKVPLLFTVLAILTVISGITAYLFFFSPVHDMSKLLKEGKCERAVQQYNREINGDLLQERMAKPVLKRFLDGLPKVLVDGEMTYAEVSECLEVFAECKNKEVRSMAEDMVETMKEVYQGCEAYEIAENYYEQGYYDLAIKQYAQITEASPYYQDVLAKMSDCKTKFKANVLEKTEGASTRREYQKGLSLLEIGKDILPDDPEIEQRYQEMRSAYFSLVKQETIDDASIEMESQNYLDALAILETGLSIVRDDKDLMSMKQSVENAYADTVIAEADSLVSENKYDAALARIETALAKFPEYDSLKERYAEILSEKPAKLSELKITEEDHYKQITEGLVEDTIGNSYTPGNLFKIRGEYGYAVYYLGREYKTLRMKVAIADETSANRKATLAAYGNTDTAIYTSDSLTRATVPFDVELDVRDLEWLTFRVHGSYSVYLYLIEPVLYK